MGGIFSSEEALRRRAMNGDAEAQFQLSHSADTQVNPNDKEAVAWLKAAAEQGHHRAVESYAFNMVLGNCGNIPRERRLIEAGEWLKKAAANGSKLVLYYLGNYYYAVEHNGPEALKCYKQVVALWDTSGYAQACEAIAALYASGLGDDFPRNHQKAIKWYRRAAAYYRLRGVYNEVWILQEIDKLTKEGAVDKFYAREFGFDANSAAPTKQLTPAGGNKKGERKDDEDDMEDLQERVEDTADYTSAALESTDPGDIAANAVSAAARAAGVKKEHVEAANSAYSVARVFL